MKALRQFISAIVAALTVVAALGQTNVSFPDPNLEGAVRAALGKTNGLLSALDMAALTNLTSSWPITNLSGLEYATNLASLGLYGGDPASFAPVAHLVRLSRLNLEFASPANCAGVSNLTSLRLLDLFESSLTNVSWLVGLTNLTAVDLSWNHISDFSPLAQLPSLHDADLSGNPVGNCAGLAGLTNLDGTIYLENASLTNIVCLGSMRNLTGLSLYQNQVMDSASLSNLTGLTTLDLAYNPMQNYDGLAGLTNLKNLYLEGNSLTNLSRLPVLPKLAMLDVNFNHLRDAGALAGFTNLQWLNLGFNYLTNVSVLTNITALTNIIFLPSPWRTVYLELNLLNTNVGSGDMNVVASLQSNSVSTYYDPQHQPPFVSVSGNLVIPANETSTLRLTVADDLIPGERLAVSLDPTNTALWTASLGPVPLATFPIPSSTILAPGVSGVYGPNGPQISGWGSYLNLTAASNQTGIATVKFTAKDETGLASTSAITVTVISAASFDGQAAGSSNSNITWRTFGSSPWLGQTNVSHMGISAAQSGSGDSWLEASVAGPGAFSFWWLSDQPPGEPGGMLTALCAASGLSGNVWLPGSQWRREILSIPAGKWILRWQAEESFAGSPPRLWVADACFTPGPPPFWLDVFGRPGPGYFSLDLHGAPGEVYDLETSADLRHWSRAARGQMPGFQNSYLDSKAIGAARFYRMSKPKLVPMWFEKPSLDGNKTVHLTLHAEPDQPLRIESSTNLLAWETLIQTNNPVGLLQVVDSPPASSSLRFYRARVSPWSSLPQPAQPPSFSLFRSHFSWSPHGPFFPVLPPRYRGTVSRFRRFRGGETHEGQCATRLRLSALLTATAAVKCEMLGTPWDRAVQFAGRNCPVRSPAVNGYTGRRNTRTVQSRLLFEARTVLFANLNPHRLIVGPDLIQSASAPTMRRVV